MDTNFLHSFVPRLPDLFNDIVLESLGVRLCTFYIEFSNSLVPLNCVCVWGGGGGEGATTLCNT